MTDDELSPPDGPGDFPGEPGLPDGHGSPEPVSTNGAAPANRPAVRSGLAHRRNPVLTKLSELA